MTSQQKSVFFERIMKDDLLLEFCDRAGKEARRTLTNEQRQHNKPARLTKIVTTCPAKVRELVKQG